MASLVGQQLKDTYDSLLKTSDNDALGAYKEITDGSGNGSNLYLGTGGNVGIGGSPSQLLHLKKSGTPVFQITDTQASGKYFLTGVDTNNTFLRTDASILFQVGGTTERMKIHSTGDISFRDGSANEAFYWDASTARLGIGTTDPQSIIHVSAPKPTYTDSGIVFRGGTTNNNSHSGISLMSAGDALAGFVGSNFFVDGSTNSQSNTSRSSGYIQFANTTTAGKTSDIIFGGLAKGTTTKTERMRIDSSGNVQLASSEQAIQWASGNGIVQAPTNLYIRTSGAGGNLLFQVNNDEKMRIDSSGNVLVGKTTTSNADAGIELNNTGQLVGTFASGSHILGRNTTDGAILTFNKDNTPVGSIGSRAVTGGSASYIQLGLNGEGLAGSNLALIGPANGGSLTDGVLDLGASGARFKDIYATNGTIQTSDINEKQDIEELNDAELRVAQKAKTLLRKYRWKSSVEEKGDDARIHFGIIAQDLEQAFADEGLDAGRYGMFIKSTWTNEEGEEQTRLGVRYNQLLAFIISAL